MPASPKFRLTVLCLIPVLLSGAISATLLFQQSQQHISSQNSHFARVFTSYLAMTATQFLINDDLLGINVVLNQMHKDDMFDFASVYDGNDKLVAQVGERHNDALVMSQEVTFQDSTAGYVQAGYNLKRGAAYGSELVSTIVLVHLLIAIIILALIWLAADLVAIWVYGARETAPVAADGDTDEPSEEVLPELNEGALLVLKLTPSRLMPTHRDLIFTAAAVYGGRSFEVDAMASEYDDVVIQFRQQTAAFSAVCAGLLIRTLVTQMGKPLQFKLGLHWSDDLSAADEQELKHTTYLASISEQAVLASKRFAHILSELDDIQFEAYRSSMAPDGEVFEILGANNQKLLDRQAEQLLSSR
ncbi:MAG: hypothetical protein ACE37D_02680 [Pseudomonadales bacterium]